MRIKWVSDKSCSAIKVDHVGSIEIKIDSDKRYKVSVFKKELWGRFNSLPIAKAAALQEGRSVLSNGLSKIAG